MNKSQQQDMVSLYHLHSQLDRIEGQLKSTLPLTPGQSYPARTQIALSYIHSKAQQIACIAAGLRNYK